jgi:hypothetical protein
MIKSTVHSTKEDSLVSLKVHDPYYRGKPLYICIAKEWFDRVNGNSYWSARVENIEEDITISPACQPFLLKVSGFRLSAKYRVRASGFGLRL